VFWGQTGKRAILCSRFHLHLPADKFHLPVNNVNGFTEINRRFFSVELLPELPVLCGYKQAYYDTQSYR
jgi:hypothetical protein